MCIYIYIYIYIYVCYLRPRAPKVQRTSGERGLRLVAYGFGAGVYFANTGTPNLPTNIVDFRGFDSSTIFILRGGIPQPIGIS